MYLQNSELISLYVIVFVCDAVLVYFCLQPLPFFAVKKCHYRDKPMFYPYFSLCHGVKPHSFMTEHSNVQRSSLNCQQFYLLNTPLCLFVCGHFIPKGKKRQILKTE